MVYATVPLLAITLTPAALATGSPRFPQLALRNSTVGANTLTLGAGFTSRFTFTIIAEDGIAAAPFTLIVVQRMGASNNAWTGSYLSPASPFAVLISSALTLPGTHTIRLNFTALRSAASLAITLADTHATISSSANGVRGSSLQPSLALAVGINIIEFIVTSESGAQAGPYTIIFFVASPDSPGPPPAAAASSSSSLPVSSLVALGVGCVVGGCGLVWLGCAVLLLTRVRSIRSPLTPHTSATGIACRVA